MAVLLTRGARKLVRYGRAMKDTVGDGAKHSGAGVGASERDVVLCSINKVVTAFGDR